MNNSKPLLQHILLKKNTWACIQIDDSHYKTQTPKEFSNSWVGNV